MVSWHSDSGENAFPKLTLPYNIKNRRESGLQGPKTTSITRTSDKSMTIPWFWSRKLLKKKEERDNEFHVHRLRSQILIKTVKIYKRGVCYGKRFYWNFQRAEFQHQTVGGH